ncbi:hypothetical protein LMG8526HA_01390 [Lactococcus lactis]|nr:hypothetical protein [Lactococcus lactis]
MKRFLIVIGITLGSLLVIVITPLYIWSNLEQYSIYYAQHLPHKTETDPVMVAVISNLDSIDIPNAKDNGGNGLILKEGATEIFYYFDIDGLKSSYISIDYNDNPEVNIIFKRASIPKYRYEIDYIKDGNTQAYYFDKSARLKEIQKWKKTDYEGISQAITDSSLKNVKNYQNQLYGELVKQREVPKINLQSLYNLVNEGKFN